MFGDSLHGLYKAQAVGPCHGHVDQWAAGVESLIPIILNDYGAGPQHGLQTYQAHNGTKVTVNWDSPLERFRLNELKKHGGF